MKAPEIFPFYMSESYAYDLIKKHASSEYREAVRFHTSNAYHEYTAKVQENGDVELSVWYRDDDGFAQTAGTCMRKTVRPFSEKALQDLKKKKMMEIATEVYLARKKIEDLREIATVHVELFGKESEPLNKMIDEKVEEMK